MKKLNWLVIGIGDVTSKRVLPAILEEPRSTLHAIVTRDLRKAEAYPCATAFTSLEQALGDGEIDAVYVASPVALHAAQTIASLRAGKHVLCEKPVGMNYFEAETPLYGPNGGAPAGWGDPYQEGTMFFTNSGDMIFRDDKGHEVRFLVRRGATAFKHICA